MKLKAPLAETVLDARDLKRLRETKIALIRAEYNAEITKSLEEKCIQGLREAGIRENQIESYRVPGCFEIPLFAQRLALRKRYGALIALGAVIRGETLHFDLVAWECARGVMDVSLKHNVPVIFEVLAVNNRRDALRRAGNGRDNKGFEAARAALAVLAELRRLEK
jgi:6,7-dimethyl-8-ribityllumazine synthase